MVYYSMDKGFDISDEGFYAYLAKPSQQNSQSPLQYDLFFKLFYQYTGVSLGLIELRIIRLFIYLIAVSFTWKLFKIFIEKQAPILGLFVSWNLVFAGYSFLPQTLSYNHITSILGIIFFYGFIHRYHLKNNSISNLIYIALAIVFLLYVKISVALLLFFLIFLCEFYLIKTQKFRILKIIIGIFMLFEFAFYFALESNLLINLFAGIDIFQHRESYQFFYLAKTLAVGLMWSFAFFLCGMIFQKGGSETGVRFYSFRTISILLFLLILSIVSITDESVYILPSFLLFMLGYLIAKKWRELSSSTGILVLLLLGVPFVVHAGSNVYFLRLVNHNIWSWGLAVCILMPYPKLKSYSIILSVIVSIIVFDGMVFRPFGQDALWNQTQSWSYSNGSKSIKISRTLHKELTQLNQLLLEYEIDDLECVAFFKNPGYLYLLDRHFGYSVNIWDTEQLENLDFENIKCIIFTSEDDIPKQIKYDFLKLDGLNHNNFEFYLRNSESKKHDSF